MLASEAAFVIEHPEKTKDVEAIYLAGVDGTLHGYEAIHNERRPKICRIWMISSRSAIRVS